MSKRQITGKHANDQAMLPGLPATKWRSPASALLRELRAADLIIGIMLNAMTLKQKTKAAEKLATMDISPDGMTRRAERRAVIAWAEHVPPPVELYTLAQYQFCVTSGALAASEFMGKQDDTTLHEHIASALQSFSASLAAGLAAAGEYDAMHMQACTDAFAAGYLGRVQQELRLFREEDPERVRRRAVDQAMAAAASHNKMN